MRRAFPVRRSKNLSILCSVLMLVTGLVAAGPVEADDSETAEAVQFFRSIKRVPVDSGGSYVLTASQNVSNPNRYELRYNHQFPGQEMEASPGGVMRIKLANRLKGVKVDQLKKLRPCVTGGNDTDAIRNMLSGASSVTNLHTHGLHVSPGERSDNVMLKIKSGKQNDYKISLPSDHAPGTHWYHAHLHGSTALQVQGGMAGALIVKPSQPDQGLNPPGFPVEEHVMVLQFGAGWENSGDPGRNPCGFQPDPPMLTSLRALGDEALEEVDSLDELKALSRGLNKRKGRALRDALVEAESNLTPVLVNGSVSPRLQIQQDVAAQRLRVVNAGSRVGDYKKLWIKRPVGMPGLPMYVAAVDGVNLTKLPKDKDGNYIAYTEEHPLELAPGNRADIYFFPEQAGKYQLMMEAEASVPGLEEAVVSGAEDEPPQARRFKYQQVLLNLEIGGADLEPMLKNSAARGAGGAAEFLGALDKHLQELQQTVPAYRDGYLKPFSESTNYIKRKIVFDVSGREKGRTFLINERSYNAPDGTMPGHHDFLGKVAGDGGMGPQGQTPWPLRAGTEEEWTITNESRGKHPFHVHVSPFWIVDIVEDGKSVRENNPHDPRINRWQDTVNLPPGGSVTVRHRVSQFTGLYVIHCHILQHEDRGMMINVLTVPNQNTDPQAFFDRTQERNDQINHEINDGEMVHAGH